MMFCMELLEMRGAAGRAAQAKRLKNLADFQSVKISLV